MKKKIAVIVIFIVVLVFPMVTWPILYRFDNTEITENRPLTPFPKFSNSFISDFDEFFTDHVPFRNDYIKFHSTVEAWINGLYQKLLKALNVPYYISKNQVLFGKEDWLFYLGDQSLSYYQGTNLLTDEQLASYVEKAEKVNDYFISQGKEFKIFIAPNKDQIYFEFMPDGIKVKTDNKRVDRIVEYFKQHSNVDVIYPKQELLEAKTEMQLYYKYDTHWNNAGGHFGTLPLLDALNISRGEVVITQTSRMGGDLVNMIAGEAKQDFEFNVNYRPEFSVELGFENEAYIGKSTNPNGRKLFLLGDSFRASMVDTLSKEYTDVILSTRNSFNADRRYEKEFAEADTVVFECVERYEQFMFGLGGDFDKFISFYNL